MRPSHVKSRGFEFPHHFRLHTLPPHAQLSSGIAELTRKACLSHKLQTYTHRPGPLGVSRLVPTLAESLPAFPSPVAHSSHDAPGHTPPMMPRGTPLPGCPGAHTSQDAPGRTPPMMPRGAPEATPHLSGKLKPPFFSAVTGCFLGSPRLLIFFTCFQYCDPPTLPELDGKLFERTNF